MNKTSVTFASFIYGQSWSVKKSLLLSDQIILPLTNESTSKFINDISAGNNKLSSYFSSCIESLESIIGVDTYKHWVAPLANWFNPKYNIAMGVVPGCDSASGVLNKMGGHIWDFYSTYSCLYSAHLYNKYGIPCLSMKEEIESLERHIETSGVEKADASLFDTIFSLASPDVDSFTWEHIADIRSHKHFKSLMEKMVTLRSQELTKQGGAYESILKDLFGFIGDMNPNVNNSIFKGILTNLPIPPVNPFGISEAIKDISKSKKIDKKYGYLFLLQELKSKGN